MAKTKIKTKTKPKIKTKTKTKPQIQAKTKPKPKPQAKTKPQIQAKTKPQIPKKPASNEVIMDRRMKLRRDESDRRTQETNNLETERRQQVPRRAKVVRRRQIDPTTCERDYNQDEIEFMHALDAYKRAAGRMFPTCSEVLEVIRDLGYRRMTPDERAKLPAAAETSTAETSTAETSTAETTDKDGFPQEETLDDLDE